jgi:hypothetical protein
MEIFHPLHPENATASETSDSPSQCIRPRALLTTAPLGATRGPEARKKPFMARSTVGRSVLVESYASEPATILTCDFTEIRIAPGHSSVSSPAYVTIEEPKAGQLGGDSGWQGQAAQTVIRSVGADQRARRQAGIFTPAICVNVLMFRNRWH